MPTTQDRIERVRYRLRELQQRDTKFTVFGSGETWGGETCGHLYQLNPPIRRNVLSRYENRYSIMLPEEYREFLLAIGNGGAGPGYGLKSLKGTFAGYLQRPLMPSQVFPYTSADAERIIRERLAESQRDRDPCVRPTVELGTAGYLHLCDHGCGEASVLIITGEQRGNMWYAYEKRACPEFIGERHVFRTLGFLDWYERWLDESMRSVSASY